MNYDKLTKEQLIGIHKDALEYIEEQEKEIERLKEDIRVFKFTIKTQQEQIQELIAREDKAIEYIKEKGSYGKMFCTENMSFEDLDKLLELLKGVDKE